jgi:hypothetical protein
LLPAFVSHTGLSYDLQHLRQQFFAFSWVTSNGSNLSFSVRVRYSDHCISEVVSLPIEPNCCVFGIAPNLRIFDADRYEWSLELPAIIDALFVKPTTPIQMTPEHNGYVFRLRMNYPLPTGEKYYCFIRLKRSHDFTAGEDPVKLDLFVESAYARQTEPIRSNERTMFGRLAERLVA